MSARLADVLLLLPRPVAGARVVGAAPRLADALAEAGVGDADDVVVAGPGALADVLEAGQPAVVVEGGGARALRRAGYRTSRLLPAPVGGDVEVLLPLDDLRALRYALRRLTAPAAGARRLRNAVLPALARLPVSLPGEVVVGAREGGPPALVRAALAALEPQVRPSVDGWLVVPGQGDALSRRVVLLFSGAEPAVVVKSGRSDRTAPFDADERGLALAAAAGPVVAQHAPRLLARGRCAGRPFSVESAAPGELLARRLRRGSRSRGIALAAGLAAWLGEVAVATAGRPGELAPLAEPLAVAAGVDRRALDGVRPVLAHDDLGTWNVHVEDDGGFTVLDWESARRPGFPLWDLLYLLLDGLALLDGATTHEERAEHAVACAAGRLPSSPLLFSAVRAYAERTGLPPASVGPLAALCWVHHAGSRARRGGGDAPVPAAERVWERWSDDNALGTTWPALDERMRT